MFKKLLLPLLSLSLLLAACGPAADPAAAVATDVAATLQAGAPAIDPVATAVAATLQAAAPTAEPTAVPATAAPVAATGAISGDLSYPSSFIPPLDIVATNTETGDYFYIQTTQNTTSYTMENLPAGQYTVIAYVTDDPTDYAGGYTAAVPCGLSVDCADHSLLAVTVSAGQTTPGVNPQDWYAPPGTYPPNPLP